jgi:hypothetical protein
MSEQYASRLTDSHASINAAVTRTMWGIAIIWFVADVALGASGAFAQHPLFIGPFVVVPLIFFAAAFAASPRIRIWAFDFDTRTLVMAQALRQDEF